jgi:2-polyprenyl-3-methyl-5-hydroxy-6-metoxy-1,4-benzoquinol methylase
VVNTGGRVFESRIRNVLCPGCGLIYNDPMPSDAELSDLYRAMARDIADRPQPASARILPIERDQAEFVSGHAGVERPAVLDIGCSMGGFLAALRETGARVMGVEPSPHDAEVARTRFGLDVRPGFFEQADFGSLRFDVISLRFVFEHVRDPRAIVRRARGLLAGGGRLFIEVPNLAMPFVGLDDYFSYGHLQTFTAETLAYLCARENMIPVAVVEGTNVFESSPHPPSIRAILRSGEASEPESPNVDAVRAHLARYLDARRRLIARVAARVGEATESCRRVVVYGAGTHTAELWRACPFLAERTVAMVDGNSKLQGHRFLGVPVHSPREILSLEPDRIVVSARTAEPVIAAFLRQHGLEERTVRLYEHAGVAAA